LKISFRLGYVGTVSAGCLANDGHKVIGVDPVQTKINPVNNGLTSIIEADTGEIIASTVQAGRLRAIWFAAPGKLPDGSFPLKRRTHPAAREPGRGCSTMGCTGDVSSSEFVRGNNHLD